MIAMNRSLCAFGLLLMLGGKAFGAEAAAKVLPKVNALPMGLSADFEFRKTKIYLLTQQGTTNDKLKARTTLAKVSKSSGGQDPSITFERQYRLFGAVTGLDQRQHFGQYFDFFWRAKRPARITVRLEYRQAMLRAFVQAREISYSEVRGNQKTEFAIVGDDYFDDGLVIAWRCLLIENGRIVAQNRSYLWE